MNNQIYEAKVLGADAILLIAAILSEEKIKEFLEQSERIYQAGKDAMDELKAAYPTGL